MPAAIILAAGRGTRLRGVTGGLSKALVDVAGTPAILWILTSLLKNDVRHFLIVSSPLAERSILGAVDRALSGVDCHCATVVQEEPLGPGHALAIGLQNCPPGRPVIVVLCDTLFDEPLEFDTDWVGTASARGVGEWCWVGGSGGRVHRLYDKIEPPPGVTDVLVGLYFFRDDAVLRAAARALVTAHRPGGGELQISWLIEEYLKVHDVRLRTIDTWVDCGTEENWRRANEAMFRHRHTHQLRLRHGNGGTFVVKESLSSAELASEAEWFGQVKQVQPSLVPLVRVIGPTSYESEFLQLQLFSSLYLYSAGGALTTVDMMMPLLTSMSEGLWSRQTGISDGEIRRACAAMYVDKPVRRLDQWADWPALRQCGSIVVNDRAIPDVAAYVDDLLEPERLLGKHHSAWIHGDLHFGNILMDPLTQSIKLIDPRGRFGELYGPAGDVYYDLGKLRHSYAGLYDAILADLYDLHSDWTKGTFELRLGPERSRAAAEIDDLVARLGFDLSHVRIIEIGIFLSLIPLHAEDPQRQLAFFLRAMQLSQQL